MAGGPSPVEHVVGVRIAGAGHYVPDGVLTNADLERSLGVSDDWIVSRTGINRRRIAAEGELTSDMGVRAARMAMRVARLGAPDMQCVIVSTVTPDYPLPATACIVAAKLGMRGVPAFDIQVACSGFVYAVAVAASMIESRVYERILVVAAEKLSSITNYADPKTAVLFGDGAGAVVVEFTAAGSLLATTLGSDGADPELLNIPAGGTAEPMTASRLEQGRDKLVMDGRHVFRMATAKMIESVNAVLHKAGLNSSDVAHFIPHQANRRIVDAATQSLRIDAARVVMNIERYGNTGSASIPIALSEAQASGRLRAGDPVVFVAFGGGLSWGASIWRWCSESRHVSAHALCEMEPALSG